MDSIISLGAESHPAKMFVICGAGYEATDWHQVHPCSPYLEIAMATTNMFQQVVSSTLHRLGKEAEDGRV